MAVKIKKRAANAMRPGGSARELMRMSNISLWLENYNDLFSDFDPRPYSEKALSVDFLDEAKRASRDKVSGAIELKLMADKGKRKLKHENLIRKRLREHFNKHLRMIQAEYAAIIRKGAFFVSLGIIFMLATAFIMFSYRDNSFFVDFMIVLLEPAGWFLFWEGLDLIIFESKKIKPDLDFYMKMSRCRIEFISY